MKYFSKYDIILFALLFLGFIYYAYYNLMEIEKAKHQKAVSFSGNIVGKLDHFGGGRAVYYINNVDKNIYHDPSDSTNHYSLIIKNGKADMSFHTEWDAEIGDSVYFNSYNNFIYSFSNGKMKDSSKFPFYLQSFEKSHFRLND